MAPKKVKALSLAEATISAFQIWLRSKWLEFSDKPFNVALTKSVTDIKGFSHQNGTPTYPFGVMGVARIELDTDKGGLSKRFSPIQAGTNFETATATLFRLTPVKIGIGLQLRTDDMNDVWTFISLIYSSSPGPLMSLQMNSNGFTIQCKANFPTDMDFPVESGENGDYISLDLSVILTSWVGTFEDVGVIKTINFRVNDSTALLHNQLIYDENDGKYHPSPLIDREINYRDSYDTQSPQFKGPP